LNISLRTALSKRVQRIKEQSDFIIALTELVEEGALADAIKDRKPNAGRSVSDRE
jgi:hypothetical protein